MFEHSNHNHWNLSCEQRFFHAPPVSDIANSASKKNHIFLKNFARSTKNTIITFWQIIWFFQKFPEFELYEKISVFQKRNRILSECVTEITFRKKLRNLKKNIEKSVKIYENFREEFFREISENFIHQGKNENDWFGSFELMSTLIRRGTSYTNIGSIESNRASIEHTRQAFLTNSNSYFNNGDSNVNACDRIIDSAKS